MCGSVLTTAAISCSPVSRPGVNALHARTGELLWQFQCGSGHHSNPTTYSVDGRQYIAVPIGWGGWIEGFLPAMLGARHGSAPTTSTAGVRTKQRLVYAICHETLRYVADHSLDTERFDRIK